MRVKGIPFKRLQKEQQKKIIAAINDFYGFRVDLLTFDGVSEAVQNLDFPKSFYDGISDSVQITTDRMQNMIRESIGYTASGKGELLGMYDAINRAVGAKTVFHLNSVEIENYIKKESARLAVDLTGKQHAWLKETLLKSAKEEWELKRTIETIKADITLTRHEAQWAQNHYVRTKELYLKRYEVDGIANPLGRAENTAMREYQKKVKFYQDVRARRIAETELKRAHGFGELESCRQAIKGGVIKEAWKTWRRNSQGDNWPSTLQFDGLRVRFDESFGPVNGKTTMRGPVMFEAEINGKCTMDIDVR